MIKEVEGIDNELIKKIDNIFNLDIKNDLLNNAFTKYLVYQEDDEILGYLNYYLIYDRIEIADFYVQNDKRNMGIGNKLLEYLINKYLGIINNITLEVRCDNYVAIHLYKKYGFLEKAKRIGYYNGVDGILMERSMMK